MIKKFKESSIALSVAEDKIYDETTTFNEENINEYLAEVEEYIKCLLVLIAKEFGCEHPILIALGLEDLPNKVIESQPLDKALLEESEDEEEPDDAVLNDMLDKTKYDDLIARVLDKRRKQRSLMMESQLDAPSYEESIIEH